MAWEQTQTHIRSGHNSPEDFEQETFKTVTLSEEEGIQAVTAKPKEKETTEIVTYLFELEKGWTIEKAKQWFNEHEKKAEESFSWTGTINNIPQTGNLIRGKALHPVKTVHPPRVATNKRIPQRGTGKKRPHVSGHTFDS